MGNKINNAILEELKRFQTITKNSENLDEQILGNLGMSSGFVQNQGTSERLGKFTARQREMGEQEAEDEAISDLELEDPTDAETEEIDIPADPEAAGEEIGTDIDAEVGGDEEEIDMEIDTGTEDETELDVTELVTKQEEVNTELSDQKDILQKNTESLDDLMNKLSSLETHLTSMDDMVNKISNLEKKIEEYRPKTEEEKLGLRKYDSGPFDKTLSDFFSDKEEVFDKTGKKEYILKPDEVEDYSDDDIKQSFDPDKEEN